MDKIKATKMSSSVTGTTCYCTMNVQFRGSRWNLHVYFMQDDVKQGLEARDSSAVHQAKHEKVRKKNGSTTQ